MNRIDHRRFDRLLSKYVDADGRVDYSGWKASAADRQELRAYLKELGRASPRIDAAKSARLAFWINAYNAVTIEGILKEYPTSSIRNHTARVVGYNIWDDLPLIVGGREYSLNQIEHDVLRTLGEPRIHFAIVCASAGCPRLLNRAYKAAEIDQQLRENAVDFFCRPGNLRVDARRRRLRMSSILKWFGEDFGETQRGRLESVMPYLPEAAQSVARDSGVSVEYLDYDWSLNEQIRR